MHGEYWVIPQLDATCHGPVAIDRDGNEQRVHLHQGDLDAACGPYSVFMGLLALGLVKREDVTSWGSVGGRTNVQRLVSRMNESWTTLFKLGSSLTELTELLDGLFRADLDVVPLPAKGTTCRAFVEEHLRAGAPVVLGLSWPNGGHWVLVVGLDLMVDGAEPETCRFLILDPAQPPSTVCPWNGIIDARGSGGRYPYTWWTDGHEGDRKVAFDEALALVAKRG